MGVELVKVDMTSDEQVYKTELARAERNNIPVNIVYPADYPNRPAILLEEWISPAHALQALDKIAPLDEAQASNQNDSDPKVVAGK